MFWVLLLVGLLGLFLTALGLPGLWLFLAAALALKLLAGAGISTAALVAAVLLALLAEGIEFWAGVRYAKAAGGTSRAAWGALAGGIVGGIVGVPVFLVGSVIGSFLGSFLGALLAEYAAVRDEARAGRVALGALVGRVVATAAKLGLGCVLIVIVLVSAWR